MVFGWFGALRRALFSGVLLSIVFLLSGGQLLQADESSSRLIHCHALLGALGKALDGDDSEKVVRLSRDISQSILTGLFTRWSDVVSFKLKFYEEITEERLTNASNFLSDVDADRFDAMVDIVHNHKLPVLENLRELLLNPEKDSELKIEILWEILLAALDPHTSLKATEILIEVLDDPDLSLRHFATAAVWDLSIVVGAYRNALENYPEAAKEMGEALGLLEKNYDRTAVLMAKVLEEEILDVLTSPIPTIYDSSPLSEVQNAMRVFEGREKLMTEAEARIFLQTVHSVWTKKQTYITQNPIAYYFDIDPKDARAGPSAVYPLTEEKEFMSPMFLKILEGRNSEAKLAIRKILTAKRILMQSAYLSLGDFFVHMNLNYEKLSLTQIEQIKKQIPAKLGEFWVSDEFGDLQRESKEILKTFPESIRQSRNAFRKRFQEISPQLLFLAFEGKGEELEQKLNSLISDYKNSGFSFKRRDIVYRAIKNSKGLRLDEVATQSGHLDLAKTLRAKYIRD